ARQAPNHAACRRGPAAHGDGACAGPNAAVRVSLSARAGPAGRRLLLVPRQPQLQPLLLLGNRRLPLLHAPTARRVLAGARGGRRPCTLRAATPNPAGEVSSGKATAPPRPGPRDLQQLSVFWRD